MAIVVRPVGYTGNTQRIVWALGNNVSVTAYLWGGGGGGGGNDSSRGGNGGGGGYAQVNFVVNEGDVLEVAVGGKGGGGQSGRGAAGGAAGASYVDDFYFNTRDAAAAPPVYAQFNSAYCTFLNTYGVWDNPTSLAVFDRTYTVNFPTTQTYQFTCAADNAAQFFIDGVERFYTDSYTNPFYLGLEISAGNHTIRILGTNTGGPGAVALTIDGGLSFGAGRGGNSGGSGSSGAGGGGGGATVVLLNGVPIGAAGGGGGGGGGGNVGAAVGQSAPGDRGQAAIGTYAGQNGSNKPGDGGGGGGGGGGWGGGEGGTTPAGDTGGYAGSFGLSSGTATADPFGRTPGGTSNSYWRGAGQGGVFYGGDGTTGYAVFEFDVSGIFVHVDGVFNPVKDLYIKANGVWNPVNAAFIKQAGQWEPILGSTSPEFENVPNKFGTNPRDAIPGQGGGGGGCKIICQKLAEMGFFDSAMNTADQQFGMLLRDQDPDAYNGYLRWAQPVVELLEGKGSVTFRKIAFFWGRNEEHRQQIQSSIVAHYLDVIARPWAEEMAYRMKAEGYNKSNPAGRFIMNIGLSMCRSIGRFNRHGDLPMWLKTVLIWGTTTVLLVAVSAISGTDKLVNKVRKLFKRG